MKKFVKIFVILGIVLSLCGGIVTAAGYIGGGFRELTGKVSGKVSSNIPAVQSAKAQESLTFSPNEIGRLEFRLNSENIAFHPSDDGQIHIRYRTRTDVTYTTYQEQSAGSDGLGTLVFTRKDTSTGTQLFHFGMEIDEDSADVQVALPKGLSVDVLTDSGDMEFSGVTIAALSVSTVSGEADLTNVQADDLTVGTTSGDIDLEHTTVSGETNLETTSGELDLEDCTLNGPLSISSVSGDLEGQAIVSGNVTIGTTSGDVELELSGSPAHSAGNISTTSGEMNLHGLQAQADYVVNVSTVSGDVTIRH